MGSRFLIVDLDDTLVRTNTLADLTIKALRKKPWLALVLPFFLLWGRSRLKALLTSTSTLDVSVLPYRESILALCKRHREADPSHRTVLASASDERLVQAIAQHLGLFDEVLGSKPGVNLKGTQKLAAIRELCKSEGFIYVGDSRADLPIWAACSHAVLVNPFRSVLKKVQASGVPSEVLKDKKSRWPLIVKQLRPHQWVKNALVLVPLLAAHRVLDFQAIWMSVLAFVCFSVLASTVYVLNDLIDFESDRRHPSKRRRPFASGDLPLISGFVILPLLGLLALALSFMLPWQFQMIAATYFGLNLLYSFKLKEAIVIDVVLLGAFYTLRIVAGGYAAEIEVSAWLLSFSTFFFFGLAMVKRYTELNRLAALPKASASRGYVASDSLPVLALGIGSSLLALLVLALYFNSPEVNQLYHHEARLWLLIPVLLYWTARIWILAQRGEVDDDPVVFALRDRVSWLAGLAFCFIIFLGI